MEQEQKVIKPLHQLIEHSDLNLLEAALPYIQQEMRQPLAMYIKMSEFMQVMRSFQNEETLAACGLDDQNMNYEMMLQAMKMAASKEQSQKIDQMIRFMNLSRMLPSILDGTATTEQSPPPTAQSQMDLMKTLAGFMQQSQNTSSNFSANPHYSGQTTQSSNGHTQQPNFNQTTPSALDSLMKDPRTASVPPEKLQFIKSFVDANQQKSPEEMLPQIMQLSSQMKSQGLSFEKNEMELLLDIMKESMTPEEKQQIDMVLQLLG